MAIDDDDYGRRRADDYAYANFGNNALPEALPTGIQKVLVEAGMSAQDAKETAPAIVKLMDKMGPDAPREQQQKMVENFMTPGTSKPEVVASITDMALGQMKWKPPEAKAPEQAAPTARRPAVTTTNKM